MSVSVIIPTLNEADYLAETIRQVREQHPHQVIVSDGGSVDQTRAAAVEADLWLEGPRGRARQMNSAAAHADGDVLLFLHADCKLEAGALAEVERMLREPGMPRVVAGCFRQTVEDRHWLFRCIDWCATARVRLTGIVYGDQGLFVRRKVFQAIGGFPEVGLMEDILVSRRLRQKGRVAVARARIYVSPRRWRRVGIIAQTVRNWGLTALVAAGVSPDRLARYYPPVRKLELEY